MSFHVSHTVHPGSGVSIAEVHSSAAGVLIMSTSGVQRSYQTQQGISFQTGLLSAGFTISGTLHRPEQAKADHASVTWEVITTVGGASTFHAPASYWTALKIESTGKGVLIVACM